MPTPSTPAADVQVLLVVEQLRRRAPGGIGTYARGLLQGLAVVGDHDVVLHASRSPSRPDPLAALGYPVRPSRLPARALTRAWDRGWCPAPAGFDVVHATSLAAPPPKRTPAAVTVHDLLWREVPDAFPARGRRWHEAAYARALRGCRLVVTPAPEVAAAVREDAPDGVSVEVVPEGCDHLPPPDDAAAADFLERQGIGEPFLFTVSTIEPRKNLARVVSAYNEVRRRVPQPPPLVIAGFKGWGDAAPIGGEGVIVAGAISDPLLSALLRRSLAVIYAPLREGFGLPAVEAMAAGAAVVASPMPSTGGAALEVDPQDQASIADGIEAVVTDSALRERLIAEGSRRAAELTWEAAARRHVELWEGLL